MIARVGVGSDSIDRAAADDFNAYVWVAEDARGNLYLVWGEAEKDDANHAVSVKYAYSKDGGTSWSARQSARASSSRRPSPPSKKGSSGA